MKSFWILAFLVQLGSSIDLESAKESPCFAVNNTVPVDTKWMESVKTWYMPLMTRFDLYSFVIEMTGRDPRNIGESEVYYGSCFDITFHEGGATERAFGGKYTTELAFTPEDSTWQVGTFHSVTNEKFAVKVYTTLTDNESFIFLAACYSNEDQMAWAVMSPEKSLPEATINKIHKHALSLGFKKEYFTQLRYDSCEEGRSCDNKANEV